MLESKEFRQLLIADLAVARGLASAADVAAAMQRFWATRGQSQISLVLEIVRIADLAPGALRPVEEEVDRLISEAGGDAQAALTKHGGLDRSIHQALSVGGAGLSRALIRIGAGVRAPLRSMAEDRYLDYLPAGKGGQGVVYWALDSELGRQVAFKMIWTGDRGEEPPETPLEVHQPTPDTQAAMAFEVLKTRFLQEAIVTGGLDHPGIVPVYELGQTPKGVPYYTMRFVKGQRTLAKAIDGLREQPIEDRLQLLELFLKLCDTVRYAHSRGVIHRDLKPDNVALGEFGEVVLLDWGLAKLEGQEDLAASRWQEEIQKIRDAANLPPTGMAGTPGYMSPEAALGKIDQVDQKSDVYSLGAILFAILTGRPPFEFATWPEVLDRLANESPPTVLSLDASAPVALSALCERCLDPDRWMRPNAVMEVSAAIRSWQAATALEREVEQHVSRARAALDAAATAHADERLRQVERAVGALDQVAAGAGDHPDIATLREYADTLRESGIREREHASSRRLLVRLGTVALVIATALGFAGTSVFRAKERETNRALAEVLRLADIRKVHALEGEATSLEPLDPSLGDRVESWQRRVAALVTRMADHEHALEQQRARARHQTPPWLFEDDALAWQHDVLTDLVERLSRLRDPACDTVARVARLGQVAVAIDDSGWSETITRIAANPRYGRLRAVPQWGLVPLGVDPRSGLEEFAYVGSGTRPVRDSQTQELDYADDAAIVFVLLPRGTSWMGAQRENSGAPNYDPEASADESPVHEVSISPFFIAKHECTQAQWAVLTRGDRPAHFHEGQGASRRPVEQVSALDCERCLVEHGLGLPSEAQWEYACRARTTTPYWHGAGEENLARVGWYRANSGDSSHPVGALSANAFGLHDVHGNVWEWCAGELRAYPSAVASDPVAPGPGFRVARGGGWYDEAPFARAAFRLAESPEARFGNLGVRPTRFMTTE